jgi:chromosome segregation ATPase
MMLVACSPAANNAPETHSTLRFATRAKRVRNAAVVNTVLTAAQLESANKALTAQLESARERLAALEGGDGGARRAPTDADASAAAAHAEEVDALREQLSQLELHLDESRAELADEQRESAAMRTQLASKLDERDMLYDTLARFQVRLVQREPRPLAASLCLATRTPARARDVRREARQGH